MPSGASGSNLAKPSGVNKNSCTPKTYFMTITAHSSNSITPVITEVTL